MKSGSLNPSATSLPIAGSSAMQGKSQNEKRVIANLRDDDEYPYPNSFVDENQTLASIAENIRENLSLLGENPEREGLLKTPERVAKALLYLTSGYRSDPKEILLSAVFHEKYDEMVLVKDIEVFSMCEHHMLPFFGKAHVAYIPNGKIVGLSKIPRVVDVYARRLQVQERMTQEIRDVIEEVLEPKGVAVVVEAKHLCMVMRGVEKQNSTTTTSAMSGEFLKNSATRSEFMRLIKSFS